MKPLINNSLAGLKRLGHDVIPAVGVVLITLAVASQLEAQNFGVHFLGNTTDNVTGTAGVVPISGWNNIANSTFTVGSSTTILSSDGLTMATLTLTGTEVHNAWNSGLTGDGADLSLMHGILDSGSGGNATATISGLTNAYYNVYLYCFSDGTRPQNNGDWLPNYTVNGTTYYVPLLGNSAASTFDTTSASVGGVGYSGYIQGTPVLANINTPPITSSFGNYIEVILVAPTNGVITIEPEKDTTTFRSPLNGFELVPVSGSVPVPNAPLEHPSTAGSAVTAGVSVTLTASAGGTAPITYQWQTDGGSGNTPTNILGATSSNLVVNTTGWAVGTYVYDFVASNSLGTKTSPVGDIVVVPAFVALPAISVQFAGDGTSQKLGLTQPAGYALEEFWNIDSQGNGLTASNLVDYTGAPTAATVNVTYGNGNYHTSDDTSTPDGILMSGGFWSGSGFTVNVTGIPYASYNVFVYMLNDHPDRRYELILGSQTNWGSVFAGSGTGSTTVPPYTLDTETTQLAMGAQMHADLVEFTGITGGNFTINGQTPDGTVAMMGIEIFSAFNGPATASSIIVSPGGTIYSGLPVLLSENPISGALPLSYQWLTDGGLGGSLSPVAGATTSTLAVNTTALTPGNYSYQVIVTNSAGASTSAVQTITISTSPPILVNDITASPTNEGYAGETVTYSATFAGTLPITYQWLVDTGSGPTPISTASNPTANTPTLVLSNLKLANAGTYSLSASNAIGGPAFTSSSVLTVVTNLPTPASSYAYGAAVLANHPLAYWPLNDANNPLTGGSPAFDASGNGYYGVYAPFCQNGFDGIPGPQAPQFPGFPTTNGALQTTLGQQSCFVSATAGEMTAGSLTYTAWIYPNAPVENWAGILMDRGAKGTGFGFGGSVDGTGMSELGYTWNANSSATWGFNSFLFPTANQWNFVAMVIEPSQATLYLIGTNGVVQSTNNVIIHDSEEFGVAWHIGNDFSSGVDDGSRVFPGSISSVGVYLSALSSNQIVTLADSALGITPPPPPVTLHIAPAVVSGSLTLTWPQGTLLQATNLTGPWTTNSTAVSPYTVPASGTRQFFRLLLSH